MEPHQQHKAGAAFEIIETMVYTHRVRYLEDHLERMRASASFFAIPFDERVVLRRLADLLEKVDPLATYKVRLTLGSTGEVSGSKTRIFRDAYRLRKICLSPHRVDSKEIFFYHKTSRRDLYEAAYKESLAAGFDEVLFLNEDGLLTEASRHNVFIRLGQQIYTPPLHCGLLGGIYRKNLLQRCNKITEKALDLDDLRQATALYLCNAVRGLRKVTDCVVGE